jgi:hypothetical protein
MIKPILKTTFPVSPTTAKTIEGMGMKEYTRTTKQNAAMHVWFKEVADECVNNGVTMNSILMKVAEMQVDELMIKSLFRKIGLKKYGKDSTTKLNPMEVNRIYDEMVKFFATQVDPPTVLPPFPSLDNSELLNN